MGSASEDRIFAAVDNAEEIQDPLDELLAHTKVDPGAPFTPGMLEALIALQQKNRPSGDLHARLKRAGCRVTASGQGLG